MVTKEAAAECICWTPSCLTPSCTIEAESSLKPMEEGKLFQAWEEGSKLDLLVLSLWLTASCDVRCHGCHYPGSCLYQDSLKTISAIQNNENLVEAWVKRCLQSFVRPGLSTSGFALWVGCYTDMGSYAEFHSGGPLLERCAMCWVDSNCIAEWVFHVELDFFIV